MKHILIAAMVVAGPGVFCQAINGYSLMPFAGLNSIIFTETYSTDWKGFVPGNAGKVVTAANFTNRNSSVPVAFTTFAWSVNTLHETTSNLAELLGSSGVTLSDSGGNIMTIVNPAVVNPGIEAYPNSPGGNNVGSVSDPDIPKTGNNPTLAETRARVSIWAMKMATTDEGAEMPQIEKEVSIILNNANILSNVPGTKGRNGIKYADRDSIQTWIKPLDNGEWAVCFINRSCKALPVYFEWRNTIINYRDARFELNLNKNKYKLEDVWGNRELGITSKAFSANVDSHDVLLLKLVKANESTKRSKQQKQP